MAPSARTSSHALPKLPGYTITEQLYLGSRTVVYRAIQMPQQRPVVIKMLRREYPSFGELVQFRNQYTITKNLPISGIVQPLSLVPVGTSYALVMEDVEGISLEQYAQRHTLTVAEVLAIALQIADILHDLCQHRVVHKDVKPANIVIHPESKQVKLIDFSIASLLPKETQEIQSPNGLEGTLAYLAPEQTGRMNRGIDYRADFYALGVTLYQLLTQTLPFASDDPLELMHGHIAKVPVPIHQLNPGVPPMLTAIVAKLMAKNAEDRYQSALGLKHDLAQCLTEWKTTGAIAPFELGQQDMSDRFLIPEKLYGRQTEVRALLEAFDRVANGSSELILVAGFSGIGKTAVINEVHKPIVRQRGYFIKGKFDQFNLDIPLSAFVQALRDLVEQLLAESDTQLAQWRTKILAAVGDNGQVLIEVIPELEQIIGKQPVAQELSGVAAQNRFNLLFQKFIEVFTTVEHPLVVFLDDLQWADSASLQLVKLLMNDSGHLLVLGAYRDNEVSPIHPFMLTVEALKQANAIVQTITLAPLAFEDTNHLVADTLKCAREVAQPLTEFIDRKTQGNPFFTTQFLKALHEDGQIRFISPQVSLENGENRGGWECDMVQVNALSLTDDVVEFMALQLQKLPPKTQAVLKLAACIGNQFDLATLAIVSEQSVTETATALWKALQEGLILPITKTYKFFQNADAEIASDRVTVPYKFLHDRVQQAAYSLIDEAQKQATHLWIGTLLLENLSPTEREERLFEIVNHFNIGKASITQTVKREELAQLNFLAGYKAKAATAYAAALSYMEAAIDLLPTNSFESHYQLSFDLYKSRAEVEYLNGNLKAAELWIERTLEEAKTPLEKADVYNMAILQCTLQAKYPEALQAGRQALALVGIDLPEANLEDALTAELSVSTKLFQDRSFTMLAELPMMTQPEQKMAIKLLISMGPPTYRSHQRLWSVICAKAVNLCLQYGNTPEIGYIYPAFGGLRGYALNNYQGTDQLLEITLQLIQTFNNKSAESVAYLMIGSSLRHWSHPLKMATEDYLSSYRVGLESSNLQYAAYAFGHNMYCRFYQGVPLDQLFEEVTESLNFSHKHKNQWAIDLLLGGQAIILELMGIAEEDRFRDRDFYRSENEYLEQCKIHKNWQVICIFNILKTQVLFLSNQLDKALEYGQQADAEIINVAPQGLLPYPHHLFIYTLLLLALYPQATETQKTEYWKKIELYQQQLELWAQNCPCNFLHLACLVKAEVAQIAGHYLEAIDLYDRAIAEANTNGYLQEEAIANELAAKFYLNWGKEKFAVSYLHEAYYGYARWGAKAKVQNLERSYPKLLAPILQQQMALSATETVFVPESLSSFQNSSTTSSISGSSISATLDLATVLKTSQTLSSEIQLDKLLAVLLHTVLENAGADKGVLLMPHKNQWFVEAIATLDQPVQVQSMALADSLEIPHSLINTVKRSLQPIVIVDATVHPMLATDLYMAQHQPKSMLCTPILQQGKLTAILYLENRVTVGAFTSDRVKLLNVLCAQAAISLENAHLYQESQTYAQQLEQSIQQLQASETRFQKLANNIPGLIYQIQIQADGSVSIPYVSSGSQTLYGVAAEELMAGKYNLRDFEHPDDHERVTRAIIRATQTLTPFQSEWRIITPDGTVRWVQAASQPERKADGSVVFDGMLFDISDRKRMEAEQARLLAILENTSDFIGIADPTGKTLYLNRAWRDLLALESSDAAIGREISQYHPAWAVEQLLHQALPEAGRVGRWTGETTLLDRDGHEILVSQVVLAHKSNTGKVEYFSTVLRDISELKAAEAALRTSEKNLRTIFDCSNTAIFIHDLDGNLLDVNNRMLEMYQVESREMALSLATLDYAAPDNPFDQVPMLWAKALAGETVCFEWKSQRPCDRSVFDAEIILNKITLDNKAVIVASVQDISARQAALRERQQAENAVIQKSQELAQALENLQNAQLQMVQSEKMASLGNLVAGVAHEINNPIGFLNGSISNAKDYVQDLFDHLALYQQHYPQGVKALQDHAEAIDLEFLTEDLPQLLDSMQGASDRIQSISTSLRTFSRADTEYKVSANLHEGLDSSLLILKYRLKANEYRPAIQVIQDYGDLPPIDCFPGQLNQVFMNILANAIDALDEVAQNSSFEELQANPQQIRIQSRLTEENAIEICIGDNGQGMTEAVKAKIFDHLFTTKGVGKGTGLGLAIARQIVIEKHGGSLEVQSSPGQGTKFLIRLPMRG